MPMNFDLHDVDHFSAGAIGPAGQREFYLQARSLGDLVTLKIEKQQAAGLARYLEGLLAELPAPADSEIEGATGLLQPIEPAWVVGAIGVAYDEDGDRFVVAAEEALAEDDEAEPSRAQIRVTRGQVAAFIARTEELVSAGRPPCPICGGPMDPDGHTCPRSNGHHPR